MNLRNKILLGLTAVVVVAAAVVAGIGGYRYWDYRQSEHSRTEAVEAASRTVSAIFTYEHQTVEQELPKAAESLTPDFRADYLELIDKAIVPGAKEKELTVKATTQAGGVVTADRAHATVLLFLNQVTTSKESPQGATTGSRVRVTLDKDDGQWLVGSVTPI
ncbi:h domain protein [Nocardia sp. NPDC003345]